MFQFTCRVSLCMDIGNFFQFQSALHGNRQHRSPAQKQSMLFIDKLLSQFFQASVQLKHVVNLAGQPLQLVDPL